jgi:hypothetical protein
MPLVNTADSLYIGGNLASAAYQGTTQVWQWFKPNKLSGCVIWLDAATLFLADGTAVPSWPNKGTGPQPTLLGSPAPVVRVNALNGLPVIRITGGAGQYRFAATGADTTYTIVYVARRWSTRAGRVIAANYSAATTPNTLYGFWSTNFDNAYAEGWLATPGPNGITATLGWKLYSADATTSAARLFSNGNLWGTTTAAPAKGLAGTLCIGGYDDGHSEDADCEVAEVAVYNRQLSDSERQQVEGYLRTKWGIAYSFAPTDLGTNLLGWWDGNDAATVQITNGFVSTWINKAFNGIVTLTQGTAAYRPSYANRAVTFTAQILNTGSAPASVDVIVVGRPKPAAGNDWRTLLRNAVGVHPIIIENGTTRFGTYNAAFFPAGGLTWDNVSGIGYGRFADNAVAMLSRDGGAVTSTGTTIPTNNAAPSYVGGYQGPPPSQGFGDINELIFATYNMADATRQLLEGYLAWKWGLAGLLPAGHPYKTAAP